MSRRTGTDGSLLASLPWTLAALTFSILPHVPFLPLWVTAAFVGCSAWRWQVERKRWRLPPAWVRIFLALLSFAGIILAYETVSGVGPGTALLGIMAALKLMETKKRRDQFVLLFISIFLMMSSLLREQYLWSLPYLIIGVMLTMTAWLHLSGTQRANIGVSFAAASRLVMYATPLMIAMWVFFPRIATPFWAVPIDTGRATSGLSDTMSPGDISSLSSSNAVAFRVNFDAAVPPPNKRYWRGLVLYRYNGRSWNSREPSPGSRAREAIEYEGDAVSYQIQMEATRQRWIPALDVPASWSLKRNTFMGAQQQLVRIQPINQRLNYSVTSYTDFRLNNRLSDYWRDIYLKLPDNSEERSVTLAQEMRAAAGSDMEFIRRVLRKFNNEEYFYTLEPPALGVNPVDAFLFDTKRGFCEHYASAFAVLMRAAGIPSRVVLGYQGGEMNPMGKYMIVRQADAHAWNEVWLPGRGWVRIDPTAAVAPERIDAGRSGALSDGSGADWGFTTPSEFLYQVTLAWDALNTKWNEWVVAYGPENQNRFMNWLGMEDPDWRKMMLTLVAILVTLITIISLLLVFRYRPAEKDKAARLYAKFIAATGIEQSVGETPIIYLERIKGQQSIPAEAASTVTVLYLNSRYGPPATENIPALEAAVSTFANGR